MTIHACAGGQPLLLTTECEAWTNQYEGTSFAIFNMTPD